MATTHVPEPGPLNKNIDLEALLARVHKHLKEARADEDKSDNVDDASYNEGMADAFQLVQRLLTSQ